MDNLEGVIAYAMDQSAQPEAVIVDAIDLVHAKADKERTAIEKRRRKKLRNKTDARGIGQCSMATLNSGPAVASGGSPDYSRAR